MEFQEAFEEKQCVFHGSLKGVSRMFEDNSCCVSKNFQDVKG